MSGELETPKVPAPKPDDPEDVSWALSTAEAMWSRGEHTDAIKWIRRGAEAASEAEADARALELAKAAADLSAMISREMPPPTAARTQESPHARTLVSPGNASTRPPASMPPPSAPPPAALPAPSPVRPSTSPRPATSPPRAPSNPPPRGPAAARGGAPRPLQVASPAMPVPGRGVLSPRVEARRRRSSGDFGQHVANMAAQAAALMNQSPLAQSTAEPPEPILRVKTDRHTPPGGMPAVTLRDGPRLANDLAKANASANANANQTMEMPALSADPETILRAANASSAATAPPSGGWDEHPTQSMAGPLEDHSTVIGEAPYRGDAPLPPLAPPNQARLVTSQAVRVILWRDANGVHIAPHGTVVSAITVDAIVVAMEPSADLAAWLEWKLGSR